MATWYYKNNNANGWNDVANWKDSDKGTVSPAEVPWTTELTKGDDLYVKGTYNTDTPIPLNVQIGSPTGEWEITGTFLNTSGTVTVSAQDIIRSGNWNCSVINRSSIRGGTFNGTVTNEPLLVEPGNGYIYDGVFNGSVVNNSGAVIENGVFNGSVTNNNIINNGHFTSTVSNEKANGSIYNGIFDGEVSNDQNVYNGLFTGHFINLSSSNTSGGIFSGTLTNYYRVTGAILACTDYDNLQGLIELGSFIGCSYLKSGTLKIENPINGECFITAKTGVAYPESLSSIVLSDVIGSGLL